MNLGLVISATFHAVLLLAALLTITRVPPFDVPPPPAIAISLATPAELQMIAKGERNAKNLEAQGAEGTAKKEPPKQPVKPPPPPPPKEAAAPPPPPPAEPEPPKQVAAVVEPPPPPPPAKETPPPPPPGPSPEERKKLEDAILQDQAKAAAEEEARKKAEADAKAKADAEARAKAEAERKRLADIERQKKLAEEKRKQAELAKKKAAEAEARAKAEAEAKAKQFNADDILKKIEKADDGGPKQALLDNAKPKPAQAAGAKSPNAAKGPRAGDATGTAPITQGEANQLVALLRDQLARCWNINSGHPDAQRMIPKFEFELNRDGTLRSEPKLVNGDNSPAFLDAANAARRAFQCAAPFKGLPPDKYEHWEYASFTFDPSRMFR